MKTGVPTLEEPDGSRTASACMQDTFARATQPASQARRATIGYVVYKASASESAAVLANAFSSVYEPEGLPDVVMPIPSGVTTTPATPLYRGHFRGRHCIQDILSSRAPGQVRSRAKVPCVQEAANYRICCF